MRIMVLLALLLIPTISLADDKQITMEELSKTVVFLRQQFQETALVGGKTVEIWYKDPNGNIFKPKISNNSGTGFAVSYHGNDYLVTAKHVAKSLQPSGEIILNQKDGNLESITFQWLSQQQIIKGAHWFHHPLADISIHPLAYSSSKSYDFQNIGEDLLPRKDLDTDLLNDTYFMGFPLGIGVKEKLSPVAKEAKIASKITTIDFPDISPELKFILLDQAIAQGYSGSPIFCNQKQGDKLKIRLLGLVSGTIQDSTGGKIGLVLPISYIWDIFDSPEFKLYENNRAN